MHVLAILFALAFLAVVLLDAFQTVILPRRPAKRLRITRIFFIATWPVWRGLTMMVRSRKTREQLYSIYGPLSLLTLFAFWATLLIAGFALLYFGLHMPFTDPTHPVTSFARLRSCFYVSGTTMFTLGLGDVVPATHAARALVILQSGMGFAFFALVIGYVPVIYTAFSHREVTVAMLDSRAGSPPTAGELLVRHGFDGGREALDNLLAEWERWAAEMLETHVSYPILCYYRSQHDNQSWLSALTAVLDTCALLITTVEGANTRQAQLTFAMGRHTLVDLGHVFHLEGQEQHFRETPSTRLPDEEFARLCDALAKIKLSLCADRRVRERLLEIRKLYEPHACALAAHLRLDLPLWVAAPPDPAKKPDLWTSVAGMRSPNALTEQLTKHVSAQSAASRLEDDDGHAG